MDDAERDDPYRIPQTALAVAKNKLTASICNSRSAYIHRPSQEPLQIISRSLQCPDRPGGYIRYDGNDLALPTFQDTSWGLTLNSVAIVIDLHEVRIL